jgi:Flp pilus assembly pilin Flp
MRVSRGWLGAGSRPDERGATAVEWMMIVGLAVAALVLVATLGSGWAGDVV